MSHFSAIVARVNRYAETRRPLAMFSWDGTCWTMYHHDCVCDICIGKRPCGCGNHE